VTDLWLVLGMAGAQAVGLLLLLAAAGLPIVNAVGLLLLALGEARKRLARRRGR
jgi:hypothetical protein